MEGQLYLSASLLTTLSLELVKLIWRKWVIKMPDFDFPPVFYELMLPFLSALWSIVLGLIGWADPVVFEWQALLQWAITIVVSMALYYLTLKPFNTYTKSFDAKG